jgi:hypothetical protein
MLPVDYRDCVSTPQFAVREYVRIMGDFRGALQLETLAPVALDASEARNTLSSQGQCKSTALTHWSVR